MLSLPNCIHPQIYPLICEENCLLCFLKQPNNTKVAGVTQQRHRGSTGPLKALTSRDRILRHHSGALGPQGGGGRAQRHRIFSDLLAVLGGREAFQRVPGGGGDVLTKCQLKPRHLDLFHTRFHDFAQFSFVKTIMRNRYNLSLCNRDSCLCANPKRVCLFCPPSVRAEGAPEAPWAP